MVRRLRSEANIKLTIELVPDSSWYNNVRALVSPEEWDRLRRTVYRQAKHRCEICGGVGPRHPVECHEVWRYEDGIQRLVRMIALCPACHEVKHIGFASTQGRGDIALAHLAEVNGWSVDRAVVYLYRQADVWEERSRVTWELDVTALARYGVRHGAITRVKPRVKHE